MVKKVGDRRYWEQWAQSVGEIAERQVKRIAALVEHDGSHLPRAFKSFMTGLHKNIQPPPISQEEAIEMLAQHIITGARPGHLTPSLKGTLSWRTTPISIVMQDMLARLRQAFDKDDSGSGQTCCSPGRTRAEGIDNAEGKQRTSVGLCRQVFQGSHFPRLVEEKLRHRLHSSRSRRLHHPLSGRPAEARVREIT